MAVAILGRRISLKHPAFGLAQTGVKAVNCKSMNRIFYRSIANQDLPIVVLPEAVDLDKQGDQVMVVLKMGTVKVGDHEFVFSSLP